ncbi:MAG TPA: agmatinase, partial [Thermoplasmatales archaeon]|nr:agmatinase [Thermoplasmatales archaeon]
YDRTVSFRRGAREAPRSIRVSSWNFESYNMKTGVDFREIPVHDYGDLPVSNDDSPREMVKTVKEFSTKLVEEGKTPIGIGGEHTVSVGIISSLPRDIMVISFDAHLDFRDEYQSENYSHACVIRRLSEYVSPRNIIVVGVRSAERNELLKAEEEGLEYYDAFSFIRDKRGVMREIKKRIGDKSIYLTLDIDVIDPSYAPGTGTPEPFGLQPIDVLSCIEELSPRIIGFDLVEVCPPFDHGETSILAARLIRSTIEMIWLRRIKDKGLG